MASEIRITSTMRYAKDQAAASLTTSFTVDQIGSKFESGIQTVGTTEEVLVKNDVGTIGYISARNNDATNFVQLGAAAGEYSLHLKAGEGVSGLPWQASDVYAKSNVAPCDVEYLLIET